MLPFAIISTLLLPCSLCSNLNGNCIRGLVLTRAHSRYAGVEIRATPARTEIIIHATRTAAVLGENGRRIRELTYLIQKRFGFADGAVDVSFDSFVPS